MIPLLDDEQIMLRDSARQACADMGRSGTRKRIDHHAAWQRFAELGWTGVALPEAVGGSALGLFEAGLIAMEMGRAGLLNDYPDTVALAWALAEADANDAGIRAMLEGVARGSIGLQLRLPLDASDASNDASIVAPLGANRGYLIEFDGAALVAAPLDLIAQRPVKTIRRGDDRLITEPLSAALARGKRLLDTTRAQPAWERARMASRLLTTAQLLGAARACNAIAHDYAGVRAQFGHLIQNYQAVQHSLVDVFGALEAAEVLVNWALVELGRGAPLDAPMIASAVSFGRESMWSAAIKSYDIMGGVGFIEEHPLSELSRGVLPLMAALGSAESNFEVVAETVRKGALL